MQNPYSPPKTVSSPPSVEAKANTLTKPLIPALIGLFTYGSSSPYALVLCIEHYLDARIRPKPISTHIATLLSLIGSLIWFALAFAFLPQILRILAGQPFGMYDAMGVMTWIATAIFLCWASWRFVRHVRQPKLGISNPIEANE